MISLEKARKLKELGLLWGPCFGDWVYIDGEKKMVTHVCEGEFGGYKDIRCLSPVLGVSKGIRNLEFIWLPSLSQLLESVNASKYPIKRLYYFQGRWTVNLWVAVAQSFQGETPEDAVAEARIWILAQEGKIL